MNNLYKVLKDAQSKEVNEFPMMFAFNNEQFEEGMRDLGLKITDTDKIYSLGGGGYYKKTDAKVFKDLVDRHDREMKEGINSGEKFIYDMFHYELCNHEYGYTYDTEDTINALGLTSEDFNNDPRLSRILENACDDIKNEDE